MPRLSKVTSGGDGCRFFGGEIQRERERARLYSSFCLMCGFCERAYNESFGDSRFRRDFSSVAMFGQRITIIILNFEHISIYTLCSEELDSS